MLTKLSLNGWDWWNVSGVDHTLSADLHLSHFDSFRVTSSVSSPHWNPLNSFHVWNVKVSRVYNSILIEYMWPVEMDETTKMWWYLLPIIGSNEKGRKGKNWNYQFETFFPDFIRYKDSNHHVHNSSFRWEMDGNEKLSDTADQIHFSKRAWKSFNTIFVGMNQKREKFQLSWARVWLLQHVKLIPQIELFSLGSFFFGADVSAPRSTDFTGDVVMPSRANWEPRHNFNCFTIINNLIIPSGRCWILSRLLMLLEFWRKKNSFHYISNNLNLFSQSPEAASARRMVAVCER